MIALGAIAYQGYLALRSTGQASAASDAPTTGLSLRVERRGADLRVSWNQRSPALAKAQDAVLSIRDGEAQQQTLHLDLDRLRNGSVLYTPANTTVQFRLEVTAGDNSKLSETVLALTAAPAGTVTTTTPAVTKPAERPSSGAANPAPSASANRDRKVFTPPGPSSNSGDPVRVVMVDPPAQSPGSAPQTGPAVPPHSCTAQTHSAAGRRAPRQLHKPMSRHGPFGVRSRSFPLWSRTWSPPRWM